MEPGINPMQLFGIHYKNNVIHGKVQLVESIFDVIYTKISFLGLTPGYLKSKIGKLHIQIDSSKSNQKHADRSP